MEDLSSQAEVGDDKREIVYFGDTVNTAAQTSILVQGNGKEFPYLWRSANRDIDTAGRQGTVHERSGTSRQGQVVEGLRDVAGDRS